MKKSGFVTRDDLAEVFQVVARKIDNGQLENHEVGAALYAMIDALLNAEDPPV